MGRFVTPFARAVYVRTTSADAVSNVLLADVAGRLNGHQPARVSDDAGDLLLFD